MYNSIIERKETKVYKRIGAEIMKSIKKSRNCNYIWITKNMSDFFIEHCGFKGKKVKYPRYINSLKSMKGVRF